MAKIILSADVKAWAVSTLGVAALDMTVKEIQDAYAKAHRPPFNDYEGGHFVLVGLNKAGNPYVKRSVRFDNAPTGAMGRRPSVGRPSEDWTAANDAFRLAWESFKDANPPGSHCIVIFDADATRDEEETGEE